MSTFLWSQRTKIAIIIGSLILLIIVAVLIYPVYQENLNIRKNKIGLFILGDSTSARLYAKGLAVHFNCTLNDPKATRNPEIVIDRYLTPALVCNDELVERIGFMFHWGVSDGDYLDSWKSHRSPGDSRSSITNIITAITQFQERSYRNAKSVFIFNCNFWESARMYDKINENASFHKLIREFNTNYSTVISKLRSLLRSKQDILILQTAHMTRAHWQFNVPFLNMEIMDVARTKNLPVFRADKVLGPFHDKNSYLDDDAHQSDLHSAQLAKSIERFVKDLIGNY